MTEEKRRRKGRILESSVEELKLENCHTSKRMGTASTMGTKEESAPNNVHTPHKTFINSLPGSPSKNGVRSESPCTDSERHEEIIGGNITLKQDPGQPPKLSRSTFQKIVTSSPRLYDDEEDKTKEAKGTFQVISECSYSSKYIGSTEHDSMDCDCAEEWGKAKFTFTVQSF